MREKELFVTQLDLLLAREKRILFKESGEAAREPGLKRKRKGVSFVEEKEVGKGGS